MGQPINIDNYFVSLLNFRLDCERDQSLTPATQLLFRLLVEQANCHRWTDSFEYPLEAIERTSHLSRHAIIEARRRLKNKGYINFNGNPSRYIVYSALHYEPNRRGTPTPPVSIQQNTNTKEERKERRKGETTNAADHTDHSTKPGNNPQELAKLEALAKERLKHLGY